MPKMWLCLQRDFVLHAKSQGGYRHNCPKRKNVQFSAPELVNFVYHVANNYALQYLVSCADWSGNGITSTLPNFVRCSDSPISNWQLPFGCLLHIFASTRGMYLCCSLLTNMSSKMYRDSLGTTDVMNSYLDGQPKLAFFLGLTITIHYENCLLTVEIVILFCEVLIRNFSSCSSYTGTQTLVWNHIKTLVLSSTSSQCMTTQTRNMFVVSL